MVIRSFDCIKLAPDGQIKNIHGKDINLEMGSQPKDSLLIANCQN